jgi:CBS domain-containing protein
MAPHRTVESVMTPADRVVSIRPTTPYKDVVKLLTENQISALPVIGEAGSVVGIVSEADLLPKEARSRTAPSGRPALTARESQSRHKARAALAVELMTAPVITIGPEEDVSEAARRLETHRIKRMPVVDATGRLAGIVSRRDILRVFLRSDEELTDEVRTLLVDSFWIDPKGWSVQVSDGRVLLTGQMDRRSTVRIAEHAVGRIDGVVAVESELTYEEDDTDLQPDEDSPYKGVFSNRRRVRSY